MTPTTESPLRVADPIPYGELEPEALLRHLIEAEDRAPRALADACVAQGDAMTGVLRGAIASERAWSSGTVDEWWLLMHAGLLLGRIPSEAAGLGLVELMRNLEANAHEGIESVYAVGADQPEWERRGDPWRFYDDEAIAKRQERWREEDAGGDEDDDDVFDEETYFPPTYVRTTLKVGGNDLCPCGSGKKYKRCCLMRDEEIERDARESR